MIDLHTHILPGVDDGVRTEDEAVEFARIALGDGIRTLVATPHCRDGFYRNEREGVLREVARLRERLDREGVELEVLPGAEVHVTPDLVEKIRDGRAPTLADNGKTLLLELSMSQYPVELERLIFGLQVAGVVVLLAHPERIRYFQEDVRRYERVVAQGAYGQITTGSILGRFGEETREFSEALLRRRLVHVLSSDAHNVRGRPPVLGGARARVEALTDLTFARNLVEDWPRELLLGRRPDVPAPADPEPPRRSFWRRLFRR